MCFEGIINLLYKPRANVLYKIRPSKKQMRSLCNESSMDIWRLHFNPIKQYSIPEGAAYPFDEDQIEGECILVSFADAIKSYSRVLCGVQESLFSCTACLDPGYVLTSVEGVVGPALCWQCSARSRYLVSVLTSLLW